MNPFPDFYLLEGAAPRLGVRCIPRGGGCIIESRRVEITADNLLARCYPQNPQKL